MQNAKKSKTKEPVHPQGNQETHREGGSSEAVAYLGVACCAGSVAQATSHVLIPHLPSERKLAHLCLKRMYRLALCFVFQTDPVVAIAHKTQHDTAQRSTAQRYNLMQSHDYLQQILIAQHILQLGVLWHMLPIRQYDVPLDSRKFALHLGHQVNKGQV